MRTTDNSRRNFLKGAGTSLIGAGAVAGFGLPAWPAYAAQTAATQTKETQAATTPEKALQMLKDGNARFVQGKMLERDYMQQVKATGLASFRSQPLSGALIHARPTN